MPCFLFGGVVMKFLMDVEFKAAPVQIEVEAESMNDAWERRYELAGKARIVEYQCYPVSVEEW